jgi:arylsulfatase A-like enzyme/Flp pilus assembly protein TadD
MRRPVWTAGLAVAACLSLGARAAGQELNLLVVTIDTLRPDRLSCYGSKYLQTPRIDSLAAKGVLFERAFAHNPETLPSHTNIFLGLTPLAHGVSENSKSVVAPGFQTLAELLRGRGYATAAFVSAFPLDSRFGLDQGFETYDDRFPARARPGLVVSERPAEKTVSAALPWLAAQKGLWFCWVHLWDPHEPYAPPEPYLTRFRDDPYSGEVAYVDAQLDRLFKELDKLQLTRRTLILFTADHGESLGDHGEQFHGYFAYNATIWVPLIICAPGIGPARVKDDVSHVDVFPTICDLLGVEKPAALQGSSLLPLLRGRTRPARPIYFESLEAYLNRGWAPLRGFIEGGKKFIDLPIPELYDLAGDFGEAKNLAETSSLPAFQKRLRDIMAVGASPAASGSVRKTADRETVERLRSLGYAASRVTQLKAAYGPEDDLKTLLPLEHKAGIADRLRKQGRIAESVRILEDVIKERQDFVKAYEQLYEIYRSRGLQDDALHVYERGFAANPANYVMVSEYGIALVLAGKYRQGIEVLEKALGLFDEDARVWNFLGLAHGNLGELEKARESYATALALTPEDAILNENAGMFYVSAAMNTKDLGWARQAVTFFEKAVAADPSMPSAHNGLAGALWALGRRDEAIVNWEKAAGLDPGFAMPIYNLAGAYLEKGNKAKALEYCEKYLLARGRDMTAEERREIGALIQKCKEK